MIYIDLAFNFIRVLFLKTRHFNKLSIDWIQFFGKRSSIVIKGHSKVIIGRGIISKNNLNIRVVNARLTISRGSFFNHNCSITALENIAIGEKCSFGNNLVIVDHDHDYKHGQGFITSEIIIGNNVWVGANCIILSGTTIGDNCVIAAGSIIKGQIKENTLVIQKRTTEYRNYIESH